MTDTAAVASTPTPAQSGTAETPAQVSPAAEAQAASATPSDAAPPTDTAAGETKVGNLAADAKAEPAAEGEGEKKPDAEAKAEDKPADKPLDPKDYKLELPDGLSAEDPLLGKFLEGAAEARLGNEAVQAVIAKAAPEIMAQIRAPYEAWEAAQKDWQDQVRKDPEIGGAKLTGTLSSIAKLIDAHGDPNLREALTVTGAGNHPAVIRSLARMAQAVAEGRPVNGGPGGSKPNTADLMYPSHSKGVSGPIGPTLG